jgi:hypothetical protein
MNKVVKHTVGTVLICDTLGAIIVYSLANHDNREFLLYLTHANTNRFPEETAVGWV